ncbi:lectin-like [Cyclopterus lumpus]|uniref:lectin-like n=1 Tax=Cyclopterus lumpus TaxID=8103 RepID=UPI0014865873|nr:lectin-like [Cyclopterus lumpus]XP_034412861.1 lectin-like [Cyclopterus lumpus]XP_034412863.1 lectin-like [Cyclopterus lumpus]XP_034412864.1 lectin-like [Cyclopterus lumpus]
MERVMHLTVVTAVLLSVGILNAVTAQPHTEELLSVCEELGHVACGEGWSRIDAKRCVKYFQTPKSFDDAKEHCNSSGSELVTFQTQEEMMKAVCVTLHGNPEPESLWIGVERSGEGFVNVDGSEVKHAQWYPGQPDHFGGQENCVTINHKEWGLWNDANCKEEHHFMCVQTM